jgi:NTP pyrophosphatase (non-canonical NTP hydrolase)
MQENESKNDRSGTPSRRRLGSSAMSLRQYQELVENIYHSKDSKRGLEKTFNWFVEEIGEFSRAIRKRERAKMEEEFADCLAWLLSVGSILGIDAEEAMAKYRNGCPKCSEIPCLCDENRNCDS